MVTPLAGIFSDAEELGGAMRPAHRPTEGVPFRRALLLSADGEHLTCHYAGFTMENNPNRKILLRFGQVGALLVLAMLGLFDVAQGRLLNQAGTEILGLVRILLAMA